MYSIRVSLVLSCPMDLSRYPVDVQVCVMQISSFAYTDVGINYIWKSYLPIDQLQGLSDALPSFNIADVVPDMCDSKLKIVNTPQGTFSCLQVQFTLARQFDYFALHVYMPSILLVIVSWLSFWIDRTVIAPRVALGITTLLTINTQSASVTSKLPPVSYIKAIDIWINACIVFVFATLIELAFVVYVGELDTKRKKKRDAKVVANGMKPITVFYTNPVTQNKEQHKNKSLLNEWYMSPCRNYHKVKNDRAKLADYLSRIIFPVAFLGFNIFYWSIYPPNPNP